MDRRTLSDADPSEIASLRRHRRASAGPYVAVRRSLTRAEYRIADSIARWDAVGFRPTMPPGCVSPHRAHRDRPDLGWLQNAADDLRRWRATWGDTSTPRDRRIAYARAALCHGRPDIARDWFAVRRLDFPADRRPL